jgi:hypothetical protein
VNTAHGQLTGTHQPSSLNKVYSTDPHLEISSLGATKPIDRISMPKLVQVICGRGAVSAVQKEARLQKRKAIEISQGGTKRPIAKKVVARKAVTGKAVTKKVVGKRVISIAGKAVIKKRSQAKMARGEALNRPIRDRILTEKARPDNSK